ncbi:SDR family NAD(P)-dependent oxidoreductase [Pengzhenrongella frigida]|uniref:SDR family NAD(P)-dependent oxidoreductase n=1 Tax=Pengzhenrongella frigida TaxID=1259133 RepID=A0A4Q5N3R8_9MICO|nr:SDR family NAD(P)-dependent oxidoreductase [Cellulomonas sp. HLT2-17]RYV51277.1 SDR family NAD(P)-dependent oxidoreductase [Cellulomonas sp. HLT2-17]
MQDYTNKVVAITGAANGLGKELARRFAGAGAKLALADIDAANLTALQQELASKGADVVVAVFDVRSPTAMEDFARQAFATYGAVDLFFNNAGVIAVGTIWEQPLADWDWLLDVNVKGVLHGIKAFVPKMIAQDTACRIINTASIAGLLTVENSPAYVASKFASLSMTEVLDLQLQAAGTKVTAHVICPAVVQTDLDNCLRHRDPATYDADDPYYQTEDYLRRFEVVTKSMPAGLPVDAAVETIITEMENGTFYILTHPAYNPAITGRTAAIVAGTRPTLVAR